MPKIWKQSLKTVNEIGHGFPHRYHRSDKNKKSFFGKTSKMDMKTKLESIKRGELMNELKRKGIKLKL